MWTPLRHWCFCLATRLFLGLGCTALGDHPGNPEMQGMTTESHQGLGRCSHVIFIYEPLCIACEVRTVMTPACRVVARTRNGMEKATGSVRAIHRCSLNAITLSLCPGLSHLAFPLYRLVLRIGFATVQ